MFNRYYPLINNLDQAQVSGGASSAMADGNNGTAHMHSETSENKANKKVRQTVSQRVMAAAATSSSSSQQKQPPPDWGRIQERIRSYTGTFPSPDTDGVVHLVQGQHFTFCDQFVNTIRYGSPIYRGVIVRNFSDCPHNFFSELFKHLAKTQYPDKFIPLLSFHFPFSVPWPQSGHISELARHLEPKVLRKGDSKVSLCSAGQLINNFTNNVKVPRKVNTQSNDQRVMYTLQNEKSGDTFYLKIWFDPASGDAKYKDMKALTLRKA